VLRRSSEYGRGMAVFAVLATSLGLLLTVATAPAIVPGMVAPVVLAFGYGSMIYSIATLRRFQAVLQPIAAVGRMAFTNYILQSLVFSFIFFGFGLGQFGKVGAAKALALGCAVYVSQAVASTIWLRYYRFGPLEWLWRTLMYGRPPRLRTGNDSS
jgi:uncharacterized protein